MTCVYVWSLVVVAPVRHQLNIEIINEVPRGSEKGGGERVGDAMVLKKMRRSRKRRGWGWENQEKTRGSFLINNCAHTVVTGKEEDGTWHEWILIEYLSINSKYCNGMETRVPSINCTQFNYIACIHCCVIIHVTTISASRWSLSSLFKM